MNESIYYNIDRIHTAIAEDSKIAFQYFQWNVDKEMELRHDGAWYEVSIWSLSWADENYYLIAYDSAEDMIKHFRVDKMLHIKSTGIRREGKQAFKSFDMAAYTRKMFGMYSTIITIKVAYLETLNAWQSYNNSNIYIDSEGSLSMQIVEKCK